MDPGCGERGWTWKARGHAERPRGPFAVPRRGAFPSVSTALKCRAEAAGDDLAVPESRSVSLMSHLKSDDLREKCAPGSNVARLGNELRRWFDGNMHVF